MYKRWGLLLTLKAKPEWVLHILHHLLEPSKSKRQYKSLRRHR
jgi:hypothetical protein